MHPRQPDERWLALMCALIVAAYLAQIPTFDDTQRVRSPNNDVVLRAGLRNKVSRRVYRPGVLLDSLKSHRLLVLCQGGEIPEST